MFKLIAFSTLLAVAAANPGLLAAPAVATYGAYPAAYAAAPVAYGAYHAPAVVKTVAPISTSYSNTYKVAVKAPVVAAAPAYAYGAYGAPAYAYGAYHAPAYASAYGSTIIH